MIWEEEAKEARALLERSLEAIYYQGGQPKLVMDIRIFLTKPREPEVPQDGLQHGFGAKLRGQAVRQMKAREVPQDVGRDAVEVCRAVIEAEPEEHEEFMVIVPEISPEAFAVARSVVERMKGKQ